MGKKRKTFFIENGLQNVKGGLRAARAAWGTQANGGSEARGKNLLTQ